MPEFVVETIPLSPSVTIKHTDCLGTHRHPSAEEWSPTTQLVFPYRGVYVRHVGREQSVADANQMLFFNAGEGYRVSHPVPNGDASLTLMIDETQLDELAPKDVFRRQRLRIDPETQAMVALLCHRLRADPLETETLALTLAHRALGRPISTSVTPRKQKLIDRAKLVIASDPARRWTLGEIAAELSVSPVHLTQVFQQVEGVPLYRYQLRLRLARALELLPKYDDLTALSLDLDFSSHSHFTAAFRQLYGHSPSAFRRIAR